MRPTPTDASGENRKRRVWEAPAMTELPIATQTRSAATTGAASSEPTDLPSPSAPATKLGFSFEMSFPLSVRTE